LNRAIELSPKDDSLLALRSVAHQNLDKTADAIADRKAAIKLNGFHAHFNEPASCNFAAATSRERPNRFAQASRCFRTRGLPRESRRRLCERFGRSREVAAAKLQDAEFVKVGMEPVQFDGRLAIRNRIGGFVQVLVSHRSQREQGIVLWLSSIARFKSGNASAGFFAITSVKPRCRWASMFFSSI